MIGAGRRDEPDRGTSTIELAMYMPLLFFVILVTVQAAFLFLGNQAAGAAAREAARVARDGGVSGTPGGSRQAIADGIQRGQEYAASVGRGVLDGVNVTIALVNGPHGPEIQATVTGKGVQLVPWVPGAKITQVVEGPVEEFRPDTGI